MFFYIFAAKYSASMSNIIGRKLEIQEFERHYQSERSDFIAVYGRRRVGKTFLVKQTLVHLRILLISYSQ